MIKYLLNIGVKVDQVCTSIVKEKCFFSTLKVIIEEFEKGKTNELTIITILKRLVMASIKQSKAKW